MAAVNTGTGLAFSGEFWQRRKREEGGVQGERVQLLVADEPTHRARRSVWK